MFSSQNSQVSSDANYIEDVFSTYLYTPATSNTAINIPNGIDLSTKGGMVWFKKRSGGTQNHSLVDTVRGGTNLLTPNDTFDAYTASIISSFNTNGFTTGTSSFVSIADQNFASWTFRKQPKFFDVVTYTGDGAASRNISHSLGSTPGMVIVKRTDSSGDWVVWHRSLSTFPKSLLLNSTVAAGTSTTYANGYILTTSSTTFSLEESTDTADVNASGGTYVAYLFAHDAGGFGLTGTDNVISCGSFTTDGSGNATVSLGYEPQWVLIKSSSNADGWQMVDTMRGMAVSNGLYNGDQVLQSQASSAETSGAFVQPSATGFDITYYGSSRTYIYIAIRRGPMKVPTSGTSVFSPVERAGTGTTTAITGLGFTPDIVIAKATNTVRENVWFDRLRGAGQVLSSVNTSEENADANALISFDMNGVTVGADTTWYSGINNNNTGQRYANWFMKRSPNFFDEVCYTGTGSVQNITHNLTVKPQLIIYKKRSSSTAAWWFVYAEPLGATKNLKLDSTDAASIYTPTFNDTEPTSTVFTVGTYSGTNASAQTFVAYLFATCAGVSKVGSYTGTGATQTIACGFTGGARFVLIKRTDSTGDWYVWDTARGMVSGTDPSLLLNSSAAEVNADSIYTTTGGFQIVSTAAGINASGGTYIYLAIA